MIPGSNKTKLINVTPVLTSSTDDSYLANDYIGTDLVPMTFSNVVDKEGGAGNILGCVLIEDEHQHIAGELWLFDTTIVTPIDSAAWTITDAMAKTCLGVIPFATYYNSVLNSVCVGALTNKLPFTCVAGSKDIYGAFVTRGAPNLEIDSMTFRLSIEQD